MLLLQRHHGGHAAPVPVHQCRLRRCRLLRRRTLPPPPLRKLQQARGYHRPPLGRLRGAPRGSTPRRPRRPRGPPRPRPHRQRAPLDAPPRHAGQRRPGPLVRDLFLFFLFVSVVLMRCFIYPIPFPDVVWICSIARSPFLIWCVILPLGARSLFCCPGMRFVSKERSSPSAAESISESISG